MWRMLEFWQEEDAVGVVEIILILVEIYFHSLSEYCVYRAKICG